jgi:Mg2+ and Co2+ transporter CorA
MSSKNTEYLSIMAAIFLPLTLFTVSSLIEYANCIQGAFGMNIRELGTNGPSAWWVPVLSIPVCLLILTFIFGKARYMAHREYKKSIAISPDHEKLKLEEGLWAL